MSGQVKSELQRNQQTLPNELLQNDALQQLLASQKAQQESGNWSLTPVMPQLDAQYGIGSLVNELLIAQRSSNDQVVDAMTYNAVAAEMLAISSAWTYADAQALANVMYLCGLQNNQVFHIQVRNAPLFVDTHAFLICDQVSGIAILAFRGTEIGTFDYVDLLTDADIGPVHFSQICTGKVHSGFFRGLASVWFQLLAAIKQHVLDQPAIKHCYFTGHSMGGALAAIAVAAMFLDDKEVLPGLAELRKKNLFRGLYTYGQPMVGDYQFAYYCQQQFGKYTFRHVYQRDLVPRLPPKSTGKFVHFGNEYRGTETKPWYLNKRMTRQVATLMLSLPISLIAMLARQLTITKKLKLPVSLLDHMPQQYIDCFQNKSDWKKFP